MLVDWRVFENPFLHLDDVAMPIEEPESREAFPKILDRLFDEVISNLWRRANDLQKPRATEAWERIHALEHAQEKPQTTSEAIAATALRGTLNTDICAPGRMGRACFARDSTVRPRPPSRTGSRGGS